MGGSLDAPDAIRLDIADINYELPTTNVYYGNYHGGQLPSAAADASNITLASGANGTADAYKGYYLIIGGEKRKITGYTALKVATVDSPFSTVPAKLADYMVQQGGTVKSPGTEQTEYTAVTLPYTTNTSSGVIILESNGGMYLKIGNEYKKVKAYDLDKRRLFVEGRFSVTPNADTPYAIVSYSGTKDLTTAAGSTDTAIKLNGTTNNSSHTNYYKNYYLTMNGETRKIIAYDYASKTATVETAFASAPVLNTPFSISIENPTITSGILGDVMNISYIKTGLSSHIPGQYFNTNSERRIILSSPAGGVYVEEFSQFPTEGTEFFIDTFGYTGAIQRSNQVALREDVYQTLQAGNSELVWKTIYENGFQSGTSQTKTVDLVKKASSLHKKIVITKAQIEDYIKNTLGITDVNSFLQPTYLLKVSMIRGNGEYEVDRLKMDPSKKIQLAEIYVNTAEEIAVPSENSITPVVSGNTLTEVTISNLNGTYTNAALVIAKYNAGNQLIEANIVPVVSVAAQDFTTVAVNVNLTGTEKYRVFLWENIEGSIKPLFKEYSSK